jgi:hypothetical protein
MSFRNRLRGPLVLTTALVLGGFALLWSLPTLRAGLEDRGDPPRAILQLNGRPAGENADEFKRYVHAQLALLESHQVLDRAVSADEVRKLPGMRDSKDPISLLKGYLVVLHPADSGLLELSFRSNSGLNRMEQAAVINAVIDAYMNQVEREHSGPRLAHLEQLKKLDSMLSDKIARKREEVAQRLSELNRKEADGDLASGTLPEIHLELRSRLIELRLQRAEVEALLGRRKKEEVPQLEERSAVLEAQQKEVNKMLEELAIEAQKAEASKPRIEVEAEQQELEAAEAERNQVRTQIRAMEFTMVTSTPPVKVLEKARP